MRCNQNNVGAVILNVTIGIPITRTVWYTLTARCNYIGYLRATEWSTMGYFAMTVFSYGGPTKTLLSAYGH
ncbi:hypothetical protein BJ878DRAFT_513626, partial [Calycina marina]